MLCGQPRTRHVFATERVSGWPVQEARDGFLRNSESKQRLRDTSARRKRVPNALLRSLPIIRFPRGKEVRRVGFSGSGHDEQKIQFNFSPCYARAPAVSRVGVQRVHNSSIHRQSRAELSTRKRRTDDPVNALQRPPLGEARAPSDNVSRGHNRK